VRNFIRPGVLFPDDRTKLTWGGNGGVFCSSLNNDGLSPLDVAVLSNNRPLVKMLISFGAREGHRCKYNIFFHFFLGRLFFGAEKLISGDKSSLIAVVNALGSSKFN
jgi:ankyrin repeat protein